MKVWIEGRVVEGDEARLPVTDHGLLYGDGVFEGLRVYGRQVFRLPDHLRRMGAGARAIGLEIPGGLEALERIVLETARAHGQDEAYIRLIVTRGSGALGVDPSTCRDPQIICIVDGIRLYSEEKRSRGIDLVTVSVRRPPSDVLDPRVKSLNYLNSVLAAREARLRGADEGLILNLQGTVAEAAVANVFAVRDGVLRTPPATDGALAGITRASLLEIAEAQGIAAREVSLGRFDLIDADEVFLTGAGARMVPVASLDGAAVGTGGQRPVFDRLDAAFAEFVKTRGTPL
ncbi:MAG: branched-chain-amino-acid transaminase [Proteobacteria bacterium]|nr:branched-chain-amino-acid transaminase [Pseudomonadota bacterium]